MERGAQITRGTRGSGYQGACRAIALSVLAVGYQVVTRATRAAQSEHRTETPGFGARGNKRSRSRYLRRTVQG